MQEVDKMIVIEINKYSFGRYHYIVEISKSFNNVPSVKFDIVADVKQFDAAMDEARKRARIYKKEGQSVVLRISGVSKIKDGRFVFGSDKKFHRE
jgi:hypothetical protein